jgi:steroid delta-isomerase-like uncharacterized protein
MTPLQVAQEYFDAWNRRDAAGIAALFVEGGTYHDTTIPQPVTGEAIAQYATGLWASFPDTSFEIVSIAQNADGLVAAEWRMHATNLGPFGGLPPTGRVLSLPGADFIRVEGDKIRSVQGYFDAGAVPAALGLQIVVQPRAIGPFSFGTAVRAHAGQQGKPGAFSVTVIETRSDEEQKRVNEASRQIATAMLGMPGFLGWVGSTIGNRMLTVTAWQRAEDAQQLLANPQHRDVMQKFFGPEVASGGFISVWTPERINVRWVRCSSCAKMLDGERGGACSCGAALPEPLAYW